MKHLNRLLSLVQDTVILAKDGDMDPTSALLRTAEANDLPLSDIEFIAAQMNKAKHLVHMVKSKGSSLVEDFPLADAGEVVKRMGKSTAVLPKEDGEESGPMAKAINRSVNKRTMLKKTADKVLKTASSESVEAPVKENFALAAILFHKAETECEDSRRRLKNALELDVHRAEDRLRGDLKALSDRVRHKSESVRSQFARRILSRYGDEGRPLLQCVWHMAGIDMDEIPDRVPSSMVFPSESIYTGAAKAVDTARRLTSLRNNMQYLTHAADSFTEDFLADLAARSTSTFLSPGSSIAAQTSALSNQMRDDKNKDLVGQDLSAQTRAKLKSLRTRSSFMNAVLEDPNLRGYPIRRLVSAFNDSVQNEPELIHRPPMLRASMMSMLSSPVPDIFTMAAVGKAGKEYRSGRESNISAEERRAERRSSRGDKFVGGVNARIKDIADIQDRGLEIERRQSEEAASKRTEAWNKIKQGLSPTGRFEDISKIVTGVSDIRKNIRNRNQMRIVVDKYIADMPQSDVSEALKAGGFKDADAWRDSLVRSLEENRLNGVEGIRNLDPAIRAAEAVSQNQLRRQTEKRIDDALVDIDPTVLEATATKAGFADVDAFKASLIDHVVENPNTSDILGRKLDPMANALDILSKEDTARINAANRDEVAARVDEALKNVSPSILKTTMTNLGMTDNELREALIDRFEKNPKGDNSILGTKIDPAARALDVLKEVADEKEREIKRAEMSAQVHDIIANAPREAIDRVMAATGIGNVRELHTRFTDWFMENKGKNTLLGRSLDPTKDTMNLFENFVKEENKASEIMRSSVDKVVRDAKPKNIDDITFNRAVQALKENLGVDIEKLKDRFNTVLPKGNAREQDEARSSILRASQKAAELSIWLNNMNRVDLGGVPAKDYERALTLALTGNGKQAPPSAIAQQRAIRNKKMQEARTNMNRSMLVEGSRALENSKLKGAEDTLWKAAMYSAAPPTFKDDAVDFNAVLKAAAEAAEKVAAAAGTKVNEPKDIDAVIERARIAAAKSGDLNNVKRVDRFIEEARRQMREIVKENPILEAGL